MTICHKADSVKYFQITVAARAVPAHIAHGDCVVDDGVPCTVDSCNEDLGCVNAPDDAACDDGDSCTTDTCDPSPAGPGCVNTPNAVCGDGLLCPGESCETDADCAAGETCCNCTCEAGGGPDPECTGQTCADFTACNPNSGCSLPVCGSILGGGGAGACVEGATPCADLAPCDSHDDCPGSFCFEASCCGIPVCGPPFCTEPPVTAGVGPADECFKEDVCATEQVCTTCDGCNGACFFTAEGPTKCFFGEYFCNEFPQACTADSDCPAGSACANSCCGATCVPLCGTPPPPVDECERPAEACDVPIECTDAGGCTGLCFVTPAGIDRCFSPDFLQCGAPCTTDSDCAAGEGCSITCCGQSCGPLCGGAAAAAAGSSSMAPAAAAVPVKDNNAPTFGKKPAAAPLNGNRTTRE